MALPTWNNSGPNRYDYAINGIPFLSMASPEYPYLRQTISTRKEQIDTTAEVGEQSLQGWWYRSQSSFDLGAGAKYFDTAKTDSLARRFADSCGVEVFEEGEVTLINKSTSVRSLSGHGRMIPYATTGSDGVLVSDGNKLYAINAAGTSTTVTWGGTDTIQDIATDGGAWYVVAASGVYRGVLPSSSGTKIYSFANTYTRFTLDYTKEFLFITGNEYAWAASPTPTTLPTSLVQTYIDDVTSTGNLGFIYKYNNTNWIWTSVASGPNAVFGAGYAGDTSHIYATTVDTTDKKAAFTYPSVVAEMPPGEIILSMASYLGTYIILGTNKGVRVGIIDGDRLTLGPLSIETDGDVFALTARDNFIYAGTSKSIDAAGVARTGIYKLDLSQLTSEGFTFAWSRYLYGDATTWSSANHVCSIVPIGFTNRVAFSIHNVGVYFESTGEKVNNGWIETGKIRFDTAEDKIFQYIRVSNVATDGAIGIFSRDESNTLSLRYQYDTDAIKIVDTEASDGEPHTFLSYRFVLTRGDTNTNSPVLLSYQVKASPSYVKQRGIRVTLQCFQRESASGKTIERPVWERIENLELAEEKGSVIRFQDFNTGEDVFAIIEDVQFIAGNIPLTRDAKANPGGMLVVTLRTVI